MHRLGAWAAALLLFALTGCFTSPTAKSSTWLDRFRAANSTLPSDGVVLHICVVEEKLDNEFINHEMWNCMDQQVVGIERKALLEDNGFRVGQVVGSLPGKLQDLLVNKRTCVISEHQMLASGNKRIVQLFPSLKQCQFNLHQDGRTTQVLLGEAQPQLVVTPTLTADGRTTLHFLPQIEHSYYQQDIQAAPDPSGLIQWQIEYHRPRESYPDLGWEVTLAPNDYVVIGAFADDLLETLGAQCFALENAQTQVQRLLVIRTTRGQPEENATIKDGQEQPLPLALQAILSTTPGGGP